MKYLRFGTCSWKYPSWEGLVYSKAKGINYLAEYSKLYDTVEIDQWFWSLFKTDEAVLPKQEVAEEYAASVPEDFLFTVKVPNSITLTHFYGKSKSGEMRPNPHFFSVSLMRQFLEALSPIKSRLGMLMFQFEYLNAQKMKSEDEFLYRLGRFVADLPKEYTYGVEIRNPNYLNSRYFGFLEGHGLSHIFLQGYFMPDIAGIYSKFGDRIKGATVMRLHGSEREEMEKETGDKWNRIVEPKDDELDAVVDMIRDLENRKIKNFVNINNHYEGSSPLTIRKIRERLDAESTEKK